MTRPILKSLEEIEVAMKDDHRVTDKIKENPWCWINTKGKVIQCKFQAHDLKIMELFTDQHNPEHGDYLVDLAVTGYNRDHFIEQHWVRMSAEIISLPLKLTARQKLAIESITTQFPEVYFKEKDYFRCFPVRLNNEKNHNTKSYVLIWEKNKVKWDID